jgi:hypothetical protein
MGLEHASCALSPGEIAPRGSLVDRGRDEQVSDGYDLANPGSASTQACWQLYA